MNVNNVKIEGGWFTSSQGPGGFSIKITDPISGLLIAELTVTPEQFLAMMQGARTGAWGGQFDLNEHSFSLIGKRRVIATVSYPCKYLTAEAMMRQVQDGAGKLCNPNGIPFTTNEDKYNSHRRNGDLYTVSYVSFVDDTCTEDGLHLLNENPYVTEFRILGGS